MDEIILLVMGLLISAMGIVNICGNVSTIHSYNRRKVAEEDIPKYGRAVGIGTLIIGASLVAAYVLTLLECNMAEYVIIPAAVVGLGFIIYGQIKYNKGIF